MMDTSCIQHYICLLGMTMGGLPSACLGQHCALGVNCHWGVQEPWGLNFFSTMDNSYC